MAVKQNFLTVLLSLLIAFVIGIIIGNSLGNAEFSEINQFIKNTELNTESFLIEQELLAGLGQSCDLAQKRLSSLSNELWKLGKLLEKPLSQKDLGEQSYNHLKRKYHLMQIRTYLLYYKLNKECDLTVPVVLFYFGKKDGNSTEQGKILDQLVRDYDIKVFAVEFNYSKELNFLEDYYKVSQTPTLVIGYDKIKTGLTYYQEIEQLIVSKTK